MVRLMGPVDPKIPFASPGPTVLMLAGLQGSGKTTTAAKLARLVQEKGHRPMMVACDCHRPAAVEQLLVVGSQVPASGTLQPSSPIMIEDGRGWMNTMWRVVMSCV